MERTIYRIDNYTGNMGELVGFYNEKADVDNFTSDLTKVNGADGDFLQVTEFAADLPDSTSVDNFGRLEHIAAMAAWEDGWIISTTTYK